MSNSHKKKKAASSDAPKLALEDSTEESPGRASWRRHLIAALLIGVVTFLCHIQAMSLPFAWDDETLIVENASMREMDNPLSYFSPTVWQETHAELSSPYRPVREVILATTYKLFGPSPRAFHATVIVGHSINAMLVYLLAMILLKAWLPAVLAAGLFALHPSHIEVMGMTKNIGEVVSLFFGLLSVLAYAALMRTSDRRGMIAWCGIGASCFILGLLSKEAVIALPLILAAWACFCAQPEKRKRAILSTIPFWLVMVAYLMVQFQSKQLVGRDETALWSLPPGAGWRMLFVVKTCVAYAGILLFPVRHIPWYDFRLTGAEPAWHHVGVGLCAIALVWVGLVAFKRNRMAGLGLFCAMAALGPASNIMMNIDRPLAEQRLYVPSVGFALCLAAWLAPVLAQKRVRMRLVALTLVVFAAYGVLLSQGLTIWKTDHSLWLHGVRHAPRLVGPRLNLGNYYVKAYRGPSALAEFQTALKNNPHHTGTVANVAGMLGRVGRYDEALRLLEQADAHRPNHPLIQANLGTVCYRYSVALDEAGKQSAARQWLSRSIGHFESALNHNPADAKVLSNLGNCYMDLGDHDKARVFYGRALSVRPNMVDALYNLARVHMQQGKLRTARDLFAKAAAIKPRLPDVYYHIATLSEALGELDSAESAARKHLAQVRRLDAPVARVLEAAARLAMILEKRGQKQRAHALWLQAARLAPENTIIQDGVKRTAP
jgi:protein O-mannosyl-transferase